MVITENETLHLMQRAFRETLDAFAHPGEVRTIDMVTPRSSCPTALCPAVETVARLFVDQAVSLHAADTDADAIERYLASETHVRRAPLSQAAYVVVPARADDQVAREAVAQASCGTLLSPEAGATVIMGCERIEPAWGEGAEGAEGEPAQGEPASDAPAQGGGASLMSIVEVSGPGVRPNTVNRFAVDRVGWAHARAARGDEYPCGIEIVLVDRAGSLVAIPRTSAVAVKEGC